MGKLGFRIGNRQIISADTYTLEPFKEPYKQEKLTLYYCLALKDYEMFVPTSVSFSYQLKSEQSLASGKGHSSVISVRTMTDEDCNSITEHILTLKGFRTPSDEDSNQYDENGILIKRNLSRFYEEDYFITFLDKNTKESIGGISGILQYSDDGGTTATTVPKLTFPISAAYGVLEKFLNGKIEWTFYNEHPKFLRKLELFSK